MLKYAHENDCPWDEQTCIYATLYNHLDCLKYAHENGCPCDLKCNSTTWCEYRCDVCWKKKCIEHDSAETFRSSTLKHNNDFFYKDVTDTVCSFV